MTKNAESIFDNTSSATQPIVEYALLIVESPLGKRLHEPAAKRERIIRYKEIGDWLDIIGKAVLLRQIQIALI